MHRMCRRHVHGVGNVIGMHDVPRWDLRHGIVVLVHGLRDGKRLKCRGLGVRVLHDGHLRSYRRFGVLELCGRHLLSRNVDFMLDVHDGRVLVDGRVVVQHVLGGHLHRRERRQCMQVVQPGHVPSVERRIELCVVPCRLGATEQRRGCMQYLQCRELCNVDGRSHVRAVPEIVGDGRDELQ